MKTDKKRILEFLGYEIGRVGFSGTSDETRWQVKHADWLEKNWEQYDHSVGTYAVKFDTDVIKSIEEFDFKKNWNDLMLVVEKIESLENGSYGFTIDPWGIVVIEYKSGNENVIVQFENDDNHPKIQQYYSCVTDFIQWYNNQKP